MRPLGIAGATVAGYLLLFGVALWWWLAGDLVDGVLCAAPGALGVALAATSRKDRRQYVMRVLAAGMFMPVLLAMWASSHERASLWLLAFVLLHVAAFLVVLVWLGSYATGLDPLAGVAPVSRQLLRARLLSLHEALGPRVTLSETGPDAWTFDFHSAAADGRTHRVALALDEARHAVSVREMLGATAAAPRTEHEASMRAPGEPWFDPARPQAQAFSSRSWQSTMIEPERLAQAALAFDLDRVAAIPAERLPKDGEALVTLLAALVTRSGYAWRPRLLPGRP